MKFSSAPLSAALLGFFAIASPLGASENIPAITNSLGMTFVDVPAESFMMGDDSMSSARSAHQVSIPAFRIMATEVTLRK